MKSGPEIADRRRGGGGRPGPGARAPGPSVSPCCGPRPTSSTGTSLWSGIRRHARDAMGTGMEPAAGPPRRCACATRSPRRSTVTLAQPISGLLVLHRLVGLERNGVEAARADQARARLDTAQRASEAYLRLLQARALAGVAAKSVAQVEAQLERAQVLEKGGALGHGGRVAADLGPRQPPARGCCAPGPGVEVGPARRWCWRWICRAGTPIEVVDDFPDPPPPLVTSEARVRRAALQRPTRAGAPPASAPSRPGPARAVAKSALLPNILGVATYQHTEGQSTFQPKNAWFVGGHPQLGPLGLGQELERGEGGRRPGPPGGDRPAAAWRDQVAFEAQRRLLEARAAYESLALARCGAGRPPRRPTGSSRCATPQGAATTTDVLDAETDVLARAQLATPSRVTTITWPRPRWPARSGQLPDALLQPEEADEQSQSRDTALRSPCRWCSPGGRRRLQAQGRAQDQLPPAQGAGRRADAGAARRSTPAARPTRPSTVAPTEGHTTGTTFPRAEAQIGPNAGGDHRSGSSSRRATRSAEGRCCSARTAGDAGSAGGPGQGRRWRRPG